MAIYSVLLNLILFFSLVVLTGCKHPSEYLSSFKEKLSELSWRTNKSTTPSSFSISGTTSGYGSLRTDGIADFGLVLKSFSKLDLFQIELNDLMSTEFDEISVVGTKINLPSNVALPEQKERFFLSITLNKPNYKLNYDAGESKNLVLINGQFPFQDVVQGFRNDQPLLKLADKFNILSYSDYDFENLTPSPKMNLNLIAGQKKHGDQITVSSPKNFNSDYSFVIVSLDKNTNYLPHNLTVLSQNKTQSLKVSSRDAFLFSGLIHDSFADSESKNLSKYKMSFQINQTQQWTSELLGFIENLSYRNDELSLSLPSINGFNPHGYFYTIYKISSNQTESLVFHDFHLGPWTNKISLSSFEALRAPGEKYRIDLFLLATKNASTPRDFTELIENSEYVSRNSLNL